MFAADASAQTPVSSAEGRYSIMFPATPQRNDSSQAGVSLTTYVVRAGDNVFVLAEGLFASDIPDAAAMMDQDVTGYINSLEGGRETSRQSADFVTSSGKLLPARQFSFESNTMAGKGLVVVSGRRDIVIGAQSIKPNGTGAPNDKFIASFRLEK